MHVQQVVNAPYFKVDVDRTRAEQLGLTAARRGQQPAHLRSERLGPGRAQLLARSRRTASNTWSPSRRPSSGSTRSTPCSSTRRSASTAGQPDPEILGNVASIAARRSPAVVSHYNVQPVFDVYANVDGRDLGSVATAVRTAPAGIRAAGFPAAASSACAARCRAWTLPSSAWAIGVVFAIVLVYLLMVVNFQSWLDPFIIIMALPGRPLRHRLDALPHPHDPERALADGRDHVRRAWRRPIPSSSSPLPTTSARRARTPGRRPSPPGTPGCAPS